jgi:hypothetical protein
MATVDRQRIVDALWSADLAPEYKVWAILDGARDNRIYSAVTHLAREKYCLYRGKLPTELLAAAPYLVQLEPDDALFNYIVQLGWGKSWGIFLRAQDTGEQLRRHFRRFLMVQDESGKQLIFRYYDPRVLRVYLPTCKATELQSIFGPVAKFAIEAQDPELLLEHSFDGKKLLLQELQLAPSASEPPRPSSADSSRVSMGSPAHKTERAKEGLIIRTAQMETFVQASENRFEERMAAQLRELFPRAANKLGNSHLRDAIRYGVVRARVYGITRERDISRYIGIMFMFGPNFDRKMEFGRLSSVLRDPHLTGSGARTDALCEAAVHEVRKKAERQSQAKTTVR